ncbi:PaaI family thioesterase [Actinomyces bowdenii]|uniref:PaaI family thioesterase n=1 Tax=Actinomyces bowdenii TaxID=131109 RepID=A0A853ELT4_9ACTO|nr:PaaI family thioesterase [Actinomyces bowdenii]MBF0696868.1 PaaI family thioesterase [Actinomyces bowdenii]NYS69041.1 PaaI family thioesterase [Actinomyces bowdenii]
MSNTQPDSPAAPPSPATGSGDASCDGASSTSPSPNGASSGTGAAERPTVVGPLGPVGQTLAALSASSSAPVAFPDPGRRPYPDPRPAGSAISAFSAVHAGLEEDEEGTLMETLRMEVVQRDADLTQVRMPVDGARQVVGILHGGATAALIETAASVAAREAAPTGSVPVGSELTVSHLRPAEEGWVTAVATPIHRGRRTAVYEVSVSDEKGRHIARGTLRSLFT